MNPIQPNYSSAAARIFRRLCMLFFSAAILFAGCQHHTATQSANSSGLAANAVIRTAFAVIMPSQDATTQPADNNVTGAVVFTQTAKGVMIIADIAGLEPNSSHAIAIHESGDLSAPDLSSVGDRFNPYHRPHGAPGTQPVQAGDLGNLTADANGNAHLELEVTDITLGTGAIDDIVGKSVIIHANPDDLSSQPAGNCGPRIAGGVIRVK
jgi:Cu-Zn family superoxide dismutase